MCQSDSPYRFIQRTSFILHLRPAKCLGAYSCVCISFYYDWDRFEITSVYRRFAGNPAVCPTNTSSSTLNPLCLRILDDVVQYDTTSTPEYPSNICSTCENITIGYRLVSPSFTLFDRYDTAFVSYLSGGLNLTQRQVVLRDYTWQRGPRLAMTILLFPERNYTTFVESELNRLYNSFSEWLIPGSEVFGPYEMISFEPRSMQIGRHSTYPF